MSRISRKKNIQKQQRGFTLLETLVAVFILTLALTGPIYIATLAIRSSVESRDNVSAYYLAEEAIEAIRNNRDTIALTDSTDANWVNTITGNVDCKNANTVSSPNTCYMTRDAGGVYRFTQCAGSCPALAFNPNGSIIYGEDSVSGYQNSKFTREIYLQVGSQDGSTGSTPLREIKVVVTVKWQDRGRDRQLQLVERLHNQQYKYYYTK